MHLIRRKLLITALLYNFDLDSPVEGLGFSDAGRPAQPMLCVRTTDSPVAGTIREILSSEDGQDIAEYAVLLALILVLVIGALRVMGGTVNGTFSRVADQLQQLEGDSNSD